MLPDLRRVASEGWLGNAIEVTDEADIQQINHIRRAVFGGAEYNPLQHLGEAETCHVIEHWPEFAGAWWISDDRDALRFARFRGITTRETIDLVSMAVLDGGLAMREGFDLLQTMSRKGQRLRLPATPADLTR